MKYTPIFTPPVETELPAADQAPPMADRRDGRGYIYTDDILLRVNVALATGRTLLVSGDPGAGKSSLARSVANGLKWRYYEEVITSRTQARDLLWRFDTLRRLSDAELGRLTRNAAEGDELATREASAKYLTPGVLWWAFNRASAMHRGLTRDTALQDAVEDPNQNTDAPDNAPAVVLLDEIDKADPDVPNDLLVPLGSYEFTVEEIGAKVELADRYRPPLVIITTNGERELPKAFLRRCVTLELKRHTRERLVEIAIKRFEPAGATPTAERRRLYKRVAQIVCDAAKKAEEAGEKHPPASTAEYLDTLRACLTLKVRVDPKDEIWRSLEAAALRKQNNQAGVR